MRSDGKAPLVMGTLLLVLAVVGIGLPLLSWFPMELAWAGLVFLVLGLIFTGVGIPLRAKARLEAEIRERGIEAQARLVNWWIIGKSGGEMELVEYLEFELEVMVGDKPPYTTKHRQLVPFAVYSQLSRGMILPVKVHREKADRVMLDWERGGAQVAGGMVRPVEVMEVLRGLMPVEEKGDLKDRLRELEDAHKEGLISTVEYESKRADILKDL